MSDLSLLEMVLIIFGVLVTMAVLCCLCCLFIKISDRKMKGYIIETAKRQGVSIDAEKLDAKNCYPQEKNGHCSIIVPDLGIVM